MPSMFSGGRLVRRYCRRAYSWSTSRGGCRFAPNHAGACKPGRHR